MEHGQSSPGGERPSPVWMAAVLALVLATMPIALPSPASIPCWIISILIGVLVLRTSRRQTLSHKGTSTAWLAVIVSGACLLFPVGLTVLSALFGPRVSPPSGSSCPNNLHQLGLAIGSHQSDNNNRFPDPDKWPQQTLQYVKTQGIFICPEADYHTLRKYPVNYKVWGGPLVTSYAMNKRLKGLSIKDVKKPEETVLLFESNGSKLSGGPELLPKEVRHSEKRYLVTREPYVNVLFADLHVNKVSLDEVRNLKWDPK